jgi:cytochrome bd ubiquinol oxidase subunit II
MDLPLLSAGFLVFCLSLYVVLDGFDLGVGILLLFQPSLLLRDHMVESITPTWDGNETWIVMTGITLFVAFPGAYSILLPAFYLPLIVMLLALAFRGVSFEFRTQSEDSRLMWDLAFAVGSLVAALMQGMIIGGMLQGLKLNAGRFTGSVLDVIHPLPIVTGATLACGYVVLGAGWLELKSQIPMQKFVRRSTRIAALLSCIMFGTVWIYVIRAEPTIHERWAAHKTGMLCMGVLFVAVTAKLISRPVKALHVVPFLLGLLLFLIAVSGVLIVVFPYIVPFSSSVWDSASSSTSQQYLLIGAVFVTPVVLAYSAFAYWVFRGRTPREGWTK